MTETPRSDANARPAAHANDFPSDQAVESAALAGAAAIQRLVAERNGLRGRLAAQERELIALRQINEDLRRRLLLIHQHYVDLANNVVGRLEQFDGTVREVVQDAHNGASHRDENAPPPPSLAQRLSKANAAGADARPDSPGQPGG